MSNNKDATGTQNCEVGDSREELLREAEDLLDKALAQAASLRHSGCKEEAADLLRSTHSYKSLTAFAGAAAESSLASRLEDYLESVWRGTVVPDHSADDLALRCLSALRNGHRSSPGTADGYRQLEAEITAVLESLPLPMASTQVAAPPTEAPSHSELNVRLNLAELEEMYAMCAGMVRMAHRLAEAQATPDAHQAELVVALQQSAEALRAAIRRHARLGLKAFLLPLAGGLQAMAASQSKRVSVRIDAPDGEIERPLLKAIRPALLHVLRNAVAHGIESAEERVQAGKSAEGHIRISASITDGWLRVSVTDDGRGFDAEALQRASASTPGYVGSAADHPGYGDLLSLAFVPGLSTAESAGELAGRGMGLSVAAEDATGLGGTVRLESRPGHGSRVTLSVPLPRRRVE